jgi:long-chain fatty acid transport protein
MTTVRKAIAGTIVRSILATLTLPLWLEQAHASGFAIRENNSIDMGMAGAGAASRADDAATAFSNPAGLTYLPTGFAANLGAAAALPSIYFHGNATSGGTPIAGNNGHNGGHEGLIPHIFLKYDLTDRLKGGLAVTVPFGNMVKYNSDFYGRYTPGGIETAAVSADINPSLAYKITPRFSVGAGISVQWFQSIFANAINQSALLGVSGIPDGFARFKGDDWGVGWNAGILAEPWDGTRIGFTYRSRVKHRIEGNINFQSVAGPLSGVFATQHATANISLPASTTFSVTHKLNEKLSLSGEFQWTQWSTFQSSDLHGDAGLVIPVAQRYRDSFFGAIGAIYHLSPALALRGGLAYDGSPITNGFRLAGLPDQDRYVAAVGVSYKLHDAMTLEGAYTHFLAQKASMNESVNNMDALGTTQLNGSYTVSLDYLSFDVRYKF